ncbi:hypothetical protein ONZ45_g12989 [Pleurotus djamor]|nr:hypothetical protein ONZ45_g12989 [Pleurotus djamor]
MVEAQITEDCVHYSSVSCDFESFKSWVDELVNLYTKFAILSHTWGSTEVTYEALREDPRRLIHDLKFLGLRANAWAYGCRYIWMDSICIDKSNSDEWEQSMRSMFTWYSSAYVCFVYLPDSEADRWFQRGWTLQELLAPKRIIFFRDGWQRRFRANSQCCSKQCWNAFDIDKVAEERGETVPHLRALHGDSETCEKTAQFSEPVRSTFVDNEMWRWIYHHTSLSPFDVLDYEPSSQNARKLFAQMERRSTTVPEDSAYCLLGLLGVSIPISYGEGIDHASYRLQLACAQQSNDRGLFFWEDCEPSKFNSMLPEDPFRQPPLLSPCCSPGYHVSLSDRQLWNALEGREASCNHADHTFAFTNGGLRISVILHDCSRLSAEEFTLNNYQDTKIRVFGVKATLPPSSRFKLAVIGTYGCDLPGHYQAFAVVLLKCGPKGIPQYRRVSRKICHGLLPSTDALLSRTPETVYIV